MKSLKSLFSLVAFFLFCGSSAVAQSGASGANGTYLNYNNYVNGPRTAGGDFEISTSGYLEIGNRGVMEIVGAVANRGVIEIAADGVLSIYGDMLNDGTIIVHAGAKINFYGRTWKNTITARVTDGAFINTIPGGDLNFIGIRPLVPASWLSLSPYLSSYSDGNARQFSDGANVPMDVVLHIQNTNGVELINSPTKVEGKLMWDVAKGNVVLGNNDLTFTSNATQAGFQADRYAITAGSGHVTKESYTGEWIFPVGKDTNDYTPAAITNAKENTIHVSVMDYETSMSEETSALTVKDGIQRTWNIYADIATGVSTFNLQHNTSSNNEVFSEAYNFVTRWGTSPANITGDATSVTAWQKNNGAPSTTGDLSSAGPVSGTSMRSRTYREFATTATAPTAFYTKSTEAFKPISSADILLFDADSLGCETTVSFTTGKENKVSKFQLQHSTDGKTFTTVTTFDPKGSNSTYDYKHVTAVEGINYYRLVMLEASGDYTVSKVVTTIVDCSKTDPVVILYPNPATDYINIAGLSGSSEIRIINMHGRVMSAITTTNAVENIDIKFLPAATYIAQIMTGDKEKITSIKFIKF